jgi:AAA domain
MKITDVFTPRSSHVNLKTYVPRLALERALLRSIEGTMHSVLFGESGNGKSWLYKKVLDQHGFHYKVANCANASRMRSLTSEIVNALVPPGTAQKTGYTESKEASLKALVADGKLSHQGQYDLQLDEPLLSALAKYRFQIGRGDAVLVLDNLESIFGNSTLMDELADILILLDDPRYSVHKIKFLIVGVPNGILEYFATTKNLESVSNRLEELPKVGGMTQAMVRTLVDRGFNNLLEVGLSETVVEAVASHIHHCTMGVAQRVQEYCERLAYKLEDNKNIYRAELLREADIEWLRMGMRQAYTVVEAHLNSKKTTIARRNQVVYCIGRITNHQLDSGKISEKIREEFAATAKQTNMGIGTILSELASADAPLLKKNPKTNEYRVADPRYMMCIRTMLRKQSDGTVEKLSFAY